MTIERPVFPPRRDNPLRLVGGIDTTTVHEQRGADLEQADEPCASIRGYRHRDDVQRAIRDHEEARLAYARAAAWFAEAELATNLPAAAIEGARLEALRTFDELNVCGRHLIVCMPTDPKGLVDLLMYLEKHFSTLPQEVAGRSLAFFMLNTMRLTLRAIIKYGKTGPSQ